MAIRVMIERHVAPGRERELNVLLRELRARALMQDGYISGETLVSLEDPFTHLVVSTWLTLKQWQTWESTSERQQFLQRINTLLLGPPRTTVWQDQGAIAAPGV